MILMEHIIREGHPTLRKRAEEVAFPLTDEERKKATDMLEYLKNSQNPLIAEEYGLRPGIGLAAPQIDWSKRVFAIHLYEDIEKEPLSFIAINPKIVSHSVEQTYLTGGEGCLSVDRDVPGYVPRYSRITIKAFDLDGNEFKHRLKGLPAIAFQHELDHLNGMMFYDHINKDDPYKPVEGAIPLDRD